MFERFPLGGILTEKKRESYEKNIQLLLKYKNDEIKFPANEIYFMLLRFKESGMLDSYLFKTHYAIFDVCLARRSLTLLEKIDSLLYKETKEIMISAGNYSKVRSFIQNTVTLTFEKYEEIAEITNSILEKIVDMDQKVYLVIDDFLRNHRSDEKYQKTADVFQRNWEDIKIRKNVVERVSKPAEKAGIRLPVAEDFPFFKETDSRKRTLSERKDKEKIASTKRVCVKKEENKTSLPSIPLSQPSGVFDQPDEDLDFSSNANSR